MILAIDVGGTKTLLAVFDSDGALIKQVKFPTPKIYNDFLDELADNVVFLSTAKPTRVVVGIPGSVDRVSGVGLDFGNLSWHKVPIKRNLEQMFNCPVLVENDAKLGALYEASHTAKKFSKVLYITIGTGVGLAVVTDGKIDYGIGDGGGRTFLVEHKGHLAPMESLISGRAIVKKYDKKAGEILDPDTWEKISHDFAAGLIDVIALVSPDIIVIGGGVGTYFNRFGRYLSRELKRYERKMLSIPPLVEASKPEESVIYGCYELNRQHNEIVA